MTQLIIIFRGVPEYKELVAETFVVSESEWTKITDRSFRRPVIKLDIFQIPMDIRVILNACDIVVRSQKPVEFISNNRTMTVIQEFLNNQRSVLDDSYY